MTKILNRCTSLPPTSRDPPAPDPDKGPGFQILFYLFIYLFIYLFFFFFMGDQLFFNISTIISDISCHKSPPP